jgi:hypothetical protein
VPLPGAVPPDDVLSGSNIYNTAEACLLAWMNAHTAHAFPKLVGDVHHTAHSVRRAGTPRHDGDSGKVA